MFPRPPPPPSPPKPGLRPPPTVSPSAKLTSVEDEPDDPTRMMDRLPPPQAAAQRALDHAAIFNSPTKIIPRVRSGGVLSGVGANLLAYTRRPSVNLTLLLLAGLLLVGLGFVLGSARKEQHEAPPAEPATISRPAAETRAATPPPSPTFSGRRTPT